MAMGRLALFVPLVIFLLLAAIFFAVQVQISRGEYDPQAMPSALQDRPFPEFSMPVLESGEQLSREKLLGNITLVNVWATWCPTCYYEHPYLMELAERDDIALYGINYRDDQDEARQWLAQLGNPFAANVVDEQGRLGLDLGVTGAPETYLIDPEGVIRLRFQGELNEQSWERHFKPVLEKIKAEEQ